MADKYNQQFTPPPQGPPPPYNQNAPVGFQPHTLYTQQSGSTTVVTTQPVMSQPVLIVAGANCPACRSGVLRGEFTCCGIFLGICCFPLGVICCLLMKERRCSHCRASFGSM